jgi:hypothetical protein
VSHNDIHPTFREGCEMCAERRAQLRRTPLTTAERQQRAERIARDNLDAVLGNAPSPRLDALDADDYAQLLAAFTRAALAGMEAAR